MHDVGLPLSESGVRQTSARFGISPELLFAIVMVESSGCGFLPSRKPVILFERHIFHKLTKGKFSDHYPSLSARTSGGWGPGGEHQHVRLASAQDLNRPAALMSASWGLMQVLGLNYELTGLPSINDFVRYMKESEDNQLYLAASFIYANQKMHQALVTLNFSAFAAMYNGPGYKKHFYDDRLATAFSELNSGNISFIERLRVRAIQMECMYQGLPVGAIDGILGPRTRWAMSQPRSVEEPSLSSTPDPQSPAPSHTSSLLLQPPSVLIAKED